MHQLKMSKKQMNNTNNTLKHQKKYLFHTTSRKTYHILYLLIHFRMSKRLNKNILNYKRLCNRQQQKLQLKNRNQKSINYKIITISLDAYIQYLSSEYRKKCEAAKARLESLQQKEKQYRELMSKLSGNSEKR